MEDAENSSTDLDELVRSRHEYGLCFSVLVPNQQPKADTWEYVWQVAIY